MPFERSRFLTCIACSVAARAHSMAVRPKRDGRRSLPAIGENTAAASSVTGDPDQVDEVEL
jgi:hypothetical protein